MLARRIAVLALGVIGPLAAIVVGYVVWVAFANWTGVAHASGTVGGLRLDGPVRIVRDDRGVPHVRATSVRDAFFGEGYALGSDRLFQLDVTRRYVLGELSEILGTSTLALDESSRVVDIRAAAERVYAGMPPDQRASVDAFSDGVNAAAAHEPTPPEYRALFAGFRPLRPMEALAIGYATVIELADTGYDVMERDAVVRSAGPQAVAAWYSLSDPAWDAPTDGSAAAHLPPLAALRTPATPARAAANPAPEGEAGSNAWAVGAGRSATGRALLANDPHLRRGIPGIWYLVDMAAPGFHVAGATLAGVPGVVLGHDDAVAWGVTAGYAAAARVYVERFADASGDRYRAGAQTLEARARDETFHVRFGSDRHRRYLATRHGFVVEANGLVRHAVQWEPVENRASPFAVFWTLAHARRIEDGLQALATFPGPTMNFVLADRSGRVAYSLAGAVPDDPSWDLRALDGPATPASPLRAIPFARLPQVAPSRDAVIATSNNLPYGAGYPYRLAPAFAPPYRAAEVRRALAAAPRLDVETMRGIQADTGSPAEAELAHLVLAALAKTGADRDDELAPAVAALRAFDGRFAPESRGATVVQRIREQAEIDLVTQHLPASAVGAYFANGPVVVTLMRALREHPRRWFPHDDPDAFLAAAVRETVRRWGRDAVATPYGEAYAVQPQHVLAGFGFGFWNGPRLPGSGGSDAPAVQGPVLAQSFRAVWDVGDWDAGGIDIPLGESGEPGSRHYTDLAPRWIAHALTPLPYSDAAVAKAARATLTLQP